MSDFLMEMHVFMRVGYTFSALLLFIGYMVYRERLPIPWLPIPRLATISNAFLAFFTLCMFLLRLYYWITTLHGARFATSFYVDLGVDLLILIPMAIPACRKRSVWLLLPFAVFLNWQQILQWFGASGLGSSGTTDLTRALFHDEPVIFLLLCAAYCLLLFLLYLLTAWAARLVEEPPK